MMGPDHCAEMAPGGLEHMQKQASSAGKDSRAYQTRENEREREGERC